MVWPKKDEAMVNDCAPASGAGDVVSSALVMPPALPAVVQPLRSNPPGGTAPPASKSSSMLPSGELLGGCDNAMSKPARAVHPNAMARTRQQRSTGAEEKRSPAPFP